MTLVVGLYAPAGQFLPPLLPGQISLVWPLALQIVSGVTVTSPVAPSILLTTFCITVGRAQRNSPVRRSSVYTMPVLPGIPVITLRRSPGLIFGLIQATSLASGV